MAKFQRIESRFLSRTARGFKKGTLQGGGVIYYAMRLYAYQAMSVQEPQILETICRTEHFCTKLDSENDG